ncbi:protein kinase domain-containing protein [Sorangium sp. So ce1182]|uniref:protein kinase domain-containing protein n=1 Tax=Sorangium sp. So ce1182 TaxID=3133334 RepID=UPI003F626030
MLGGRFEIVSQAGAGGMGAVFRAIDRLSSDAVAVKVLLEEDNAADDARFSRESAMLAELSHPAIVRYVAHGLGSSGAPWLAMEWLEGEDLEQRLRRQALSVDEAITLTAGVAGALAAIHARGVVHRDLKPSNLFLVGRDVGRVKLLDFGIARAPAATRITRSGALLGTPAYMAPEQARSGVDIDARADVFALGCVLFECLTGQPAFSGAHPMAVLAKILLDEVPRAGALRPGIPPALDALCARLLAKSPDVRPRDGAEVAEALAAMGLSPSPSLPAPSPPAAAVSPLALTREERRVLSVALMGPPPRPALRPGSADAPTQIAVASPDLRRGIEALGGYLELLADGSILVTLVEGGVATDQAAQAARCALALRTAAGERPLALATGRAEVTGRLPAGDLVDRAARMLAQPAPAACAAPATGRGAPIAIDEVTAGLLDARFEVVETEMGLWLQGEEALAKGARKLLGKPTACVGRDWEIASLEGLLAGCIEESRASAVLVTAPAGVGKSRLAYEIARRARLRDEPVAVWIGRGDPLRKGAALGMLRQAMLDACGIRAGEPLEVRREALRAWVAARVRDGDARRVAEFLGELLDTPFPDEESPPLRAARNDARLMGDQLRRAWLDVVGAASAAQPLLLVLEDLHWGDLPTVQFINDALRQLEDRPWLVLALARPEVHELFPGLWAGRDLHEIRLKELSPRASARLVRQVLGDEVSAETLARLVAQADGNAFYLEELIRVTVEGRGETLPETVLAMVQSRLERLDGAARQALRAASVLGRVFWRGAVEALLGGPGGVPGLAEHLDRLERLEWISAREDARFQGEREFVFRHALVREAAYGMLTAQDRALGHRLAGEWLERAAEPSAAVIAEHFDRGGEPLRAAACYQRAAAQALAANDLVAVLSWTERALDLGLGEERRGEVFRLRAEAHYWRGELAEAARWASSAMEALPRRTAPWYATVREAALVMGRLGRHDHLVRLGGDLAGAWAAEPATGPLVTASAATALFMTIGGGLYAQAAPLQAHIDAVAERFRDDPGVCAPVFHERGYRELYAGRYGVGRALFERAIAHHERAGNLRAACFVRMDLSFQEYLLGAYAEALALVRAALADADRMGLDLAVAWSNLGPPLHRIGAIEEAHEAVAKAISISEAQGDPRLAGLSRAYRASFLHRAGELAEAEAEARQALERLELVKPMLVFARATLARVLLARGRAPEALAEARAALALLASLGKVEEGEPLARLVLAEALFATGDLPAARAAIAHARAVLLEAAARLDDAGRRESFLGRVEENARTLELARAWLHEGIPAEGAEALGSAGRA